MEKQWKCSLETNVIGRRSGVEFNYSKTLYWEEYITLPFAPFVGLELYYHDDVPFTVGTVAWDVQEREFVLRDSDDGGYDIDEAKQIVAMMMENGWRSEPLIGGGGKDSTEVE